MRADATGVLSLFAVLLMLSPSVYVFAPLGSVGTPAQLVALAMLLWWASRIVGRPYTPPGRIQPLLFLMALFMGSILLSYVVCNLRPLSGAEARAADRGMLRGLALLGLVLVAHEQIATRRRLDALMQRLLWAGSAMAAIGLIQFVTGWAVVNYLKLPGLVANTETVPVGERSGFLRPAATALSPIEFGVTITMLLPLALHNAITDVGRGTLRRWGPLALVAAAVPISVSRSAIVGAVIAVVVMMPVLNGRQRLWTLLGGLGALGAVFVTIPGILGSLVNLFTGVGSDASAASRTGSYDIAFDFILQSPIWGRGAGTFLPEYRILDNQFLGTTIEQGIIGLCSLTALMVAGIVIAQRVRRRSSEPGTQQLAQAMSASLAVGFVSLAFFDTFAFPIVLGLQFLLLGCVGALARIARIGQHTGIESGGRL